MVSIVFCFGSTWARPDTSNNIPLGRATVIGVSQLGGLKDGSIISNNIATSLFQSRREESFALCRTLGGNQTFRKTSLHKSSW